MKLALPSETQVYRTPRGLQLCGDSAELLGHLSDQSVDLVMTGPPFPG